MKEVLPVAESTKALGRTLEAPALGMPVLPPIPDLEKKPKGRDHLRCSVWEVGPRRSEEAQRMRDILQRRRMEEVMRRAERQLKEADARKARRASLLLDYWVDRSLEELRQRWEKEARKKEKMEKELRARGGERGKGGKPRDLTVPNITVLSTPDTSVTPVSSWGVSPPFTPWRVRRSLQYAATSSTTTAGENLEPLPNVRSTRLFSRRPTWPPHTSPGTVAGPDPSAPCAGAIPEASRRHLLPRIASSSSAAPPDEDTRDVVQPTKVETIRDPPHKLEASRRRPRTKVTSSSFFQGPKDAHPQPQQLYKTQPPGDVKGTILDIGGKTKSRA